MKLELPPSPSFVPSKSLEADWRPRDAQMQAMAAAMLPMVWPSLQLKQTTSERPASAEMPIHYTQLDRSQATTHAPVTSSPETRPNEQSSTQRMPTTRSQHVEFIKTELRRERVKRRKPSYLEPANAPQGQPDSTRLASRYHMPKIRFAANSQPPEQSSAARSLPLEFSRLIDQLKLELSNNNSGLASALSRANSQQMKLPPTTSVSRVVSSMPQRNFTDTRLSSNSTESQTKTKDRKSGSQITVLATLAAQQATTSTTTTTTIPTTTTTAKPANSGTQLDESIGSNGVAPIDEDGTDQLAEQEAQQAKPASSGRRHRKLKPSDRKSKIKLFQFKRKPDMHKLPFYKKPVNYTELGWSREQIDEHLSALAANDESAKDGEQQPVETELKEGRQKRKRRGKNHFERLMAELHSASQQPEDESPKTEQPIERPKAEVAAARKANQATEPTTESEIVEHEQPADDQLVPVMKPRRSPPVAIPKRRVSEPQQQLAKADLPGPWLPVSESPVGKPSGGLAPSGEEGFLLAPSSPPAQVSSPATSTPPTGEPRAPVKLLVKPLRPAKYSLNGYIPKPTLQQEQQLLQQQQQQQQQQEQQQQEQQEQQPPQSAADKTSGARRSVAGSKRQASPAPSNSKDLDSSTSNEVFSRRRGVQLKSDGSAGQSAASSDLLRQLEENKRKYMVQQQRLARSPALTAQGANLIKAKLGLPLTVGQSARALASSQPAKSSDKLLAAAQPQQQQAGAIPKTDFECADSAGRFVAGLFADLKTGCQVWHLCANNRKYSFLCPAGTIFSSKLQICDWRHKTECR